MRSLSLSLSFVQKSASSASLSDEPDAPTSWMLAYVRLPREGTDADAEAWWGWWCCWGWLGRAAGWW
jgi:hypothetical protein